MNCDIPNTLEANPSPIQHTTCWKVETSQHTHIENGRPSEVRHCLVPAGQRVKRRIFV